MRQCNWRDGVGLEREGEGVQLERWSGTGERVRECNWRDGVGLERERVRECNWRDRVGLERESDGV